MNLHASSAERGRGLGWRRLFLIVFTIFTVLLVGSSGAFAQDTDGDGVPDGSDNCPTVPNAA